MEEIQKIGQRKVGFGTFCGSLACLQVTDRLSNPPPPSWMRHHHHLQEEAFLQLELT